jgi:hypothetical protein
MVAFGFTNPLLLTEDGTLIAGEGRYRAAQLATRGWGTPASVGGEPGGTSASIHGLGYLFSALRREGLIAPTNRPSPRAFGPHSVVTRGDRTGWLGV